MKKFITTIILASIISTATASYMVKMPLETFNGGSLPNGSIIIGNENTSIPVGNWISATPEYSEWFNSGSIYGCSNWSPNVNTISIGQSFTQTATDCEQDQTRNRQNREQETTTLEYRNVGLPIIENQTITTSDTREEIGTLENWISIAPSYTNWVNSSAIYGCSNWSPATSTINSGQSFTQTATDCEQDQTRNRQNREQETTTLDIRNSGSVIIENQTITVSDTRTATGTKPAMECRYVSQVSNVSEGTDGYYSLRYAWLWNGSVVASGLGSAGTTIVAGGYTYTRSTLRVNSTTDNGDECGCLNQIVKEWEICRVPL